MIEAKVIEDSVDSKGIRLTTLQLVYPRFIHAEFMTHRVFSRNASSSRAIPVSKLLDDIRENTAQPIHWGKNKPGMSADEELDALVGGVPPQDAWFLARNDALNSAAMFMAAGYHKQIVNRLTEPFQHIRVVCTSTEWDNFFKLRMHEAAQPEIKELATKMYWAMNVNKAVARLNHLPYISDRERIALFSKKLTIDELRKMSVARCARVSYLNHDQSEPNIEKDLALHDMLLEAGHMSPFEHVARQAKYNDDGYTHKNLRTGDMYSGNFNSWIQYRQEL